MQPETATSQEMLDQLLRDGKISDEDYRSLSSALLRDQSSKPAADASSAQPPWQVWPAIIACTISSIASLIQFEHNPLLALVIIALNTVLSIGLYYMNKWIYVAAVLIGFASILNIGGSPAGAIINVIIAIVLLSAYNDFFNPSAAPRSLPFSKRWTEVKAEPGIVRKSLFFAAQLTLLLIVFPMIIIKIMLQPTIDTYSQLAIQMPLAGLIAAHISNAYLRGGAFAALLLVVFATFIYLLCDASVRRKYATISLLLSLIWSLAIANAFFMAMLQLP